MFLFVGVVFTPFGLWLLLRGLKNVRTLRRARFWPRAAGKIIRAQLSKYEDAEGDIYGYTLEYAYQVEGRDYVGTEIFPGSSRMRHARMNQYEGRFPQGASVTVYHDPADPAFCVLETRPWVLSNVYMVMVGGFITVLGISMLAMVPMWKSAQPCGCGPLRDGAVERGLEG
ncbi:MAG: DUF3592 domain-containing protein [Luteolibacter sp.]